MIKLKKLFDQKSCVDIAVAFKNFKLCKYRIKPIEPVFLTILLG